MSEFVVHRAVRRACPQIICISGPSSSGKTFSALMLGAGLAGPGGKVGFIDTENGRGSMYADDPFIQRALPQGYQIVDLPSPWSPERYISAIDAIESAGCNVCIIDSGSHEHEGEGGISDIAEKDKGRWNNAKRRHKRFMARMLYSNMHIILCLRAREKSKIVPKQLSGTGKEEIIALGIQPICEKNMMYEMLTALQIEDSRTHLAIPVKIPGPLRHLFIASGEYASILSRNGVKSLDEASGERLEKLLKELTEAMKPKLLSVSDGEAIARWNNTGAAHEDTDRLEKRARAAAEIGTEEFRALWKSASPKDRAWLKENSATYEAIAKAADEASLKSDREELEGFLDVLGEAQFFGVIGRHGVERVEDANRAQVAAILDELRGLVETSGGRKQEGNE